MLLSCYLGCKVSNTHLISQRKEDPDQINGRGLSFAMYRYL
nr:MAG TPA: hypothetical protein [Caudoviricetes sp.]